MSALADAIEELAPTLAAEAYRRMYEDPFWDERFGARGRKFAVEDGRLHAIYLAQAVVMDDSSLLRSYAIWLRSVLTTRGMCTLHLAENFEHLGRLLREHELPDVERALVFLDEAKRVLAYPAGPADELSRAAPRLVPTIVSSVLARHPALEGRTGFGAARVGYDLSFLADAVAFQRPAAWIAHVRFSAGFLVSLGGGRSAMSDLLEAMEANVRQELSGHEALSPFFASARAMLANQLDRASEGVA